MSIGTEELIGPFTVRQIEDAAIQSWEQLLSELADGFLGDGAYDNGAMAYVVKDGRVFLHTKIVVEEYFELTPDGFEPTEDAPAVGWTAV